MGHSHRNSLGESFRSLIGGNPYFILEVGGVVEHLVVE